MGTLSFLRYGNRLRPARDWLVMLGFATLIFIASVAANVYFFMQVSGGEILGGGSVSKLEAPPLEEAHALFTSRVEESVRYRSEYSFIDPSR